MMKLASPFSFVVLSPERFRGKLCEESHHSVISFHESILIGDVLLSTIVSIRNILLLVRSIKEV